MTMVNKILVIMMASLVGGIVLDFVPETPITEALRTTLRLVQPVCLLWWAWVGYLNRRPHWTRESWTRFLLVSLIPLAAISLTLTVATGVDESVAWVGEGRSWLRSAWGTVALLGVIVGGGGAGFLLHRLTAGDATTQFDWFWRRQRAD